MTRFAPVARLTANERIAGIAAAVAADAAPPLLPCFVDERAGVRILDAHVDWLTIGFRPRWEPGALRRFLEADAHARSIGMAVVVRWKSLYGSFEPAARLREGWFRCGDFRVFFRLPDVPQGGELPRETPVCELTFENHKLLDLGLFGLAPAAQAIIGEVSEGACEWRVMRVDFCADVAGFPFARDEMDRLVKPSRALVVDHRNTGYMMCYLDSELYARGHTITGWSIGRGENGFAVRSYDKTEELRAKNDRSKRDLLFARWERSGAWTRARADRDPVRRLEVQLQGEFLDEVAGGRDPMQLATLADRYWAYMLNRVRLVELTDERLTRCPLDKRWAAWGRVRFDLWAAVDRVEPVARVRKRGGATAAQTWGCVLSTLGSLGRLPEVLHAMRALRAALAVPYEGDAMRVDAIHDAVRDVMCRAAEVVAAELLEAEASPMQLAERMLAVFEAKAARFAEWTPPERVTYRVPDDALEAARAMLAARKMPAAA